MTATSSPAIPADHRLAPEQLGSYDRDGFLIVRGLLHADEVAALRQRFDEISAGPAIPNHWQPNLTSQDPLARYPRIMMPHRFDELSKRILLDRRFHDIVAGLFREEPIAAQSMFYFKPCGALGQALHQDNFYLSVKPGSCMAAWVAIDPSTPENGGLYVVPGTHRLPVACPELADPATSFTTQLVRPPTGLHPVPATLAPGDVLFFHGSVIHGSEPNRSTTQWRRSYICHYIPWSSVQSSKWSLPLLDFEGRVIERAKANGGGPCGNDNTAFWEKAKAELKG